MSDTAPRPVGPDVPQDDAATSVAFERLLAEISSRFITLPPEEFEPALVQTLEQVGGFMGADRCFIFLWSEDKSHHRVAHVWMDREIHDDPLVIGTVVQESYPWVGAKMSRHEDIVVDRLSDLPHEAERERRYCERIGIQSFLMCPMFSADTVVGNLGLDAIRVPRAWSATDCRRLRLVGEVLASELLRRRYREELEARLREIQALKDRLQQENQYLRREALKALGDSQVVAESPVMKKVMKEVVQVASAESTVLLLGETGTGKELVARAIHSMSPRKGRHLVAVNCAALSPTLVESELFGREKGAYTGAISHQIGRFELADGSTLFLDEVGELSLELQSKLLRVLQSGEFERLGSPKTRRVNVRVVAATNRDLRKAISQGTFREDLYYRLNVFPIVLPPLRERQEDIPLLVWAVVRELQGKMGRRIDTIPDTTMASLSGYEWPGNVRELRNVVERAMILCSDGVLRVDLPQSRPETGREAPSDVRSVEADHIRQVLVRTGWRIRGARGAAELLGLKPTTLESRMKRLGIRRP